jgi:oxygen-independent coproporphyrinogen-3 oxidase
MSPSLYVHIPFCLKRCVYCDFVSGLYDPGRADVYVDALKKELSNISENFTELIPPPPPLLKGGIFSTLFIGGGTPTALSSGTLSGLINHIFSHFSFTEDYEATIEANPGTVEKDKLKAIRKAGINRVSIGIQSFDDNELLFLGRIHTSEEAEQAVQLARDSGFDNIGIDLIYGIPGQSIESWKTTLDKSVRLKPKHISAYELTVERGTLLYEYLMSHPHPDPDPTTPEDKIIEMYEYTIDCLTSEGYIHYEISNFSLPDCQCRHNLNYWDRGEYFGAGLGAHSFINGKRFYNTDNLDEYLGLISANKTPVKESEIITGDMALSEALFLGLRKTGGVNVEAFSGRYKKNILSYYQKEIADLQGAGLIEVVSSGCSYETALKLTRRGLILSNEVFTKFI